MNDLTIFAICQALVNITQNRCTWIENSNTCRCSEHVLDSKPTTGFSAAPDIMLSEALLIFFVLILWLSAIGFCLNQYKSLRRLETQVHYCADRKDPLNIGDIKIVEREQDSIIYKKKRYSTVPDTHINHEELKNMQYVKEYLPKSSPKMLAVDANSNDRENLTDNHAPTSPTISLLNSHVLSAPTVYFPLNTHDEQMEENLSSPTCSNTFEPFPLSSTITDKFVDPLFVTDRKGNASSSTGLTIPYITTSANISSSWNSSQVHETSVSAQHLCVPSSGLRSPRHSDGNISLPVPQSLQKNSENCEEQLLDPRLIPNTVRRSLLALHRESQENIYMHRAKEKTQSENDVHIAFIPWKTKMKSKLKRTHHHHHSQQQASSSQQQQSFRPSSNTLSILPLRQTSCEQERRKSEYASKNREYRFSTPPPQYIPLTPNRILRGSLRRYKKCTSQSTTESEPNQSDLVVNISTDASPNNKDESLKTILQIDTPSELPSS